MQKNTNQKIAYKKYIGIVAIFLGIFRFISGLSLLPDLQQLKNSVSQLKANSHLLTPDNLALLKELEHAIKVTDIYLPLVLITLFGIFVLGIALLFVEQKSPVGSPLPKTKKINYALLAFEIVYALCEVFYLIAILGLSFAKDLFDASIIGSFIFLFILMYITIKGIFVFKKEDEVITQNTDSGTVVVA